MRKGKIPYNSLIRSVLRVPFERRETDCIGRDGAFCRSAGLSVNATVYGGKSAEALAFYRSFNGALAAGIEPEGVMLSLVFPTEETEPSVKARMEAFRAAAEREGVRIEGGHTAFSDSVKVPVMTVTVFGEKAYIPEGGPLPGRDLILTKYAGDAGALVFSREKADTLKKRLSGAFLEGLGEVENELSCRAETGILRREGALLHDVSEGGLLSALYELAEGYRIGFSVDLQRVPLRQETVEICEILGGDPFSLLSTGCMLAAVKDGGRVVSELMAAGVPAAVIGEVREGRGKVLLRGGEEGFMERPGADLIMELENFG